MSYLDISPEDFILVNSWKVLSDELGLAYCSTEGIKAFFDGNPSGVVVSGSCDYGITEQSREHPNSDLIKYANSLPWQAYGAHRDNYLTVRVGPTVTENCNPADRYSIKIYRHTLATFNEIPAGVIWFTTNVNIRHPRVHWLPFGVNNDGPGHTYIAPLRASPKDKLLYVNFQNHTHERVRLKERYSLFEWATVEENLPVEAFLSSVARHKFTLCASGNGLDCFRTYEALYLGSIPVLADSVFSRYLADAGLPVHVVDDMNSLTAGYLEKVYSEFWSKSWNYDAIRLSYWREQLSKCVVA